MTFSSHQLTISSFGTSKNLLFGLPLFLFPGNFTSITLLSTYFWSLLMTCPYHLSLPSLNFISNRSTLTVPLIYSFLILSFLVTPIANLNIFISFISSTCYFVIATVSSLYTIASLTALLYTFSFTLAGNLLSQITPDTFLHPFHPICTLLFISLSQLPLSCTVNPKYLNSFTLGIFVCFIFTVFFFCHFLHLRTNMRSLTYLLSSLFFPTHTFNILISAPVLPWFLCKSICKLQLLNSYELF